MPASTLRRPALCIFCTFAASPRVLRPSRLLPHIQKAYRSGGDSRPRRNPRDDAGYKGSFNPLKESRKQGPGQQGAVDTHLERLERDMREPAFLESISLSSDAFEKEWEKFKKYIEVWSKRSAEEVQSLVGRRRFGGLSRALSERLRYLFYAQIFGSRFTRSEVENQKELADLRHPAEWYPATRTMSRTVHLHVGPTNSGKTYHALKRLEAAKSGIYLGPLRLLAHEVYTRMNAKGRPCALVTGEEVRVPAEVKPQLWSCTVEMAPLNQVLEVAVIDEIQMINSRDRGWAWTQAFLGLQAKEIHLCGEARTVPLMRQLCALVGDKVVVHDYERLTPLKTAHTSLNGKLAQNLRKGDCIVSFSVLGIHALRKAIERATGKKCAIVYGSLPPETRAQQARLFNDPDNDYDFLVASDAIGMGLNLSIKRVIFESTVKNNGNELVPLQVSEVKQIAGRAGRYRSAHQAVEEDQNRSEAGHFPDTIEPTASPTEVTDFNSRAKPDNTTIGYATTLEAFDFPYLRRCMNMEPEPITTAGLFPPSGIVERFANYFPPNTPFSYILLRLHEMSDLHPRFHLCSLKDQLQIADAIHPVQNLTVQDRLLLCAAPTSLRGEGEKELLEALARCIADGESGDLLDLPIPLETLDEPPSPGRAYLYKLEQLHKMLILYLWLSYRFPHVLPSRALANYTKGLVEEAIEKALEQFSYSEQAHELIMKKRRKAMKSLETEDSIPKEPTASAAAPTSAPNAEVEVPPAVIDVLKDGASFKSEPPSDDEGQYPTPELEVEELDLNTEDNQTQQTHPNRA